MSTRAVLVSLGIACLLAVFTVGVGFAVAPSMVASTGLVCPSDTRFATDEGAAYDRPELGDRVAPVRFSCVASDGTSSEAQFGAGLALCGGLALGFHALWLLYAARSLARLARAQLPRAEAPRAQP